MTKQQWIENFKKKCKGVASFDCDDNLVISGYPKTEVKLMKCECDYKDCEGWSLESIDPIFIKLALAQISSYVSTPQFTIKKFSGSIGLPSTESRKIQ